MTNKESLELARWTIALARKLGAQEVGVDVSEARVIEVAFRDKAIEKLQEAKRRSLTVAIYLNNRFSVQTTNNLEKGALEKFVEDALSITKYLNEDPFRRLPDPKYYAGREKRDLDVRDRSYESLSTEARIESARQAADAVASATDRLVSVTAGFSDSLSKLVKVHSNGFEGEREATLFSLYASPTIKDDAGKLTHDYAFGQTCHRGDLPDPREVGREAAERTLRRMGQKKVPSERMDMVVENRRAGQMLQPLIGPLSGAALQQKRSFLEGRMGQMVASERLTLVDDPFVVRGQGSRLFDSEGIAARRRAIIEKGVLKTFFIDNYYGRKLGQEPTTGDVSNLVVENGRKSFDEILKGVARGIFVTGFIGGNSNDTTGDFSYGISGLFIENGALGKPVFEMNISGNIKDVWSELVEVGNDPNMHSAWRMPTLHFRNVQFSGI